MNTSYRLAIYLVIECAMVLTHQTEHENRLTVNWDKLNHIEIQQMYTEQLKLRAASHWAMNPRVPDNKQNITIMYKDTMNMVNAVTNTLPQTKPQRRLKSCWSNKLTTLSREKKTSWYEWKQQGQPGDSTNQYWVRYKAAKRSFRQKQRRSMFAENLQQVDEKTKTILKNGE